MRLASGYTMTRAIEIVDADAPDARPERARRDLELVQRERLPAGEIGGRRLVQRCEIGDRHVAFPHDAQLAIGRRADGELPFRRQRAVGDHHVDAGLDVGLQRDERESLQVQLPVDRKRLADEFPCECGATLRRDSGTQRDLRRSPGRTADVGRSEGEVAQFESGRRLRHPILEVERDAFDRQLFQQQRPERVVGRLRASLPSSRLASFRACHRPRALPSARRRGSARRRWSRCGAGRRRRPRAPPAGARATSAGWFRRARAAGR